MKLVVFIGHLDEKAIRRAVILPRGTWQVISSVRIDFHVGVEDWGILCLCLCLSSGSILQIYEIVPPVGWGVLFWRRARSKEGGSRIPRFQGRGLHKLKDMCVEKYSLFCFNGYLYVYRQMNCLERWHCRERQGVSPSILERDQGQVTTCVSQHTSKFNIFMGCQWSQDNHHIKMCSWISTLWDRISPNTFILNIRQMHGLSSGGSPEIASTRYKKCNRYKYI